MPTVRRHTDRIIAFASPNRRWPTVRSLPEATAPEADTETVVEEAVAVEERRADPWRVILFNDAVHSFDEVVGQLVKATGCSAADAERIAWTAHVRGKARAYAGPFEDCFRVQAVLREIELMTEIEG